MTYETILPGNLIKPRLNIKTVALVFAATIIIALSAQISVPMFPVPMTLQTLAISIIGLTFGSRLAGITILFYLAEGAAGLPVFSNGGAGIMKLAGPTAGFLWGFAGVAFLTGWMTENGFSGSIGRVFLAAFIPSTLLFVPGVLGLWALTPLDLSSSFEAGALPFLVGDLVKSSLATLFVIGGWSVCRKFYSSD